MSEDKAATARQRLLQEAQQALLQRRAALHEARGSMPATVPDHGRSPHPQPTQSAPSLVERIAALPAGLSWESEQLTGAVRRALANRERSAADDRDWLSALAARIAKLEVEPAQPAPVAETRPTLAPQSVLLPDLAQAILRAKQAAPGRLWHLLRVLDAEGRGWVSQEAAAAAFTAPSAPLRFCGPRQLRNLLAQGQDLFWRSDATRIWLRAPARIARDLGQQRLSARPVSVAASALCGGIASVRAHFYASWHSSRQTAAPVSRRHLATRSGVAPRTQRAYDRAIGVGRAANYARGPRLGSPHAEELAWQKGQACFTWTERHHGRAPEAQYLAWQLPNSYDGPHAPRARGRQRRAQRHLADLLTKGTTGNDQQAAGRAPARAYFAGPRQAAQAYGRSAALVYWPANKQEGQFWYCLC